MSESTDSVASIQCQTHEVRQLYLYGCSSRASNSLMHAGGMEDAAGVTKAFLNDMGLSGYFLFNTEQSFPVTRFGSGVCQEVLQDMRRIQECIDGTDKICVEHHFIMVRAPLIHLFVVRDKGLEVDLGIIQDILPLYIDSLSVWVEDFLVKDKLRENLDSALSDTINGGALLIENYLKVSDELVCGMVSRFPTLGLEADQENMILDTLNASMKRHIDLIEYEIQRNSKLGDVLISTVGELLDAKEDRVPDVQSVELF